MCSSTATPVGPDRRRPPTTRTVARPGNRVTARRMSCSTEMASARVGDSSLNLPEAEGKQGKGQWRRRLLLAGPLLLALGLISLRFWFSPSGEEWRLRRAPLEELERRVAAGQADFRTALML